MALAIYFFKEGIYIGTNHSALYDFLLLFLSMIWFWCKVGDFSKTHCFKPPFLFKNSNSGKTGKIVNLIFKNPIWQMILNICQFGRQNSNLSKIKVLNTNYVFATVWKKGYVFRIVDNSFFFLSFRYFVTIQRTYNGT